MKIHECIEKRLLKKDVPDIDKAKKSLDTADHKLSIAKKELEAKIYEGALISSYAAMFHAGRALLFRDGFVEKSHFAVYAYIKERYEDRIEARYLTELNTLRLQRHAVMYGIEEGERKGMDEEEASEIIRIAEDFIKIGRELISEGG
jgi:uncharacterized protein (UPF0332 family)